MLFNKEIIYIYIISKIHVGKIVSITFLSLQVTVNSLVTTYSPVRKNTFWVNKSVDSHGFSYKVLLFRKMLVIFLNNQKQIKVPRIVKMRSDSLD